MHIAAVLEPVPRCPDILLGQYPLATMYTPGSVLSYRILAVFRLPYPSFAPQLKIWHRHLKQWLQQTVNTLLTRSSKSAISPLRIYFTGMAPKRGRASRSRVSCRSGILNLWRISGTVYVIVRENSERFSSHPLSLGFNASVCDEVQGRHLMGGNQTVSRKEWLGVIPHESALRH